MRGIVILLPFLILFSGGVFGQFQSKQVYSASRDTTHVYFGPGYGSAYGGLGAQLQIVTGENQPLGFHVGTGCYHLEENSIFAYAFGFKIYFAHLVYLGFRYSLFGQETKKYTSYDMITNVSKTTYHNIKLRGPGMYLGTDMLLIGRLGINFGVGLNLSVVSGPRKHDYYYYRSDFGIFFRLD